MKGIEWWAAGALVMILCLCTLVFMAVNTLVSR